MVNTAMLYFGDVVYIKHRNERRGKAGQAKNGSWTHADGYRNVYVYSEKQSICFLQQRNLIRKATVFSKNTVDNITFIML